MAAHIDTDSAIIEPTEPRSDRPQCSSLEKLNPPTKSDLAHERKIKNPKSTGADMKRKASAPSQSVIYFQLASYAS